MTSRRSFIKKMATVGIASHIPRCLFPQHETTDFLSSLLDDMVDQSEVIQRFIVVGDIHAKLTNHSSTNTSGVDDRTGPIVTPKLFVDRFDLLLNNLVKEESKRLDFVLFNGDLIHTSKEPRVPRLKEIKDLYHAKVNVPMYASVGNHDLATDEEWIEAIGHSRSHAFEMGDYGYIIIRSSDEDGARQICLDKEFLEQKLMEFKCKKGVFVFSHIPRYAGVRPGTKGDSPECSDILTLFQNQKNLKLVFHSHFHEEDRTFLKDGVNYAFSGHVAMYGLDYYGYRIVDIYKDGSVKTTMMDMTRDVIRNQLVI